MAYSFDSWSADELAHHGIRGMKWGVRRYQNTDGTLTAEGKARYGFGAGEGTKRTSIKKMTKDFNKLDQSYANVEHRRQVSENKVRKEMHKANKSVKNEEKYKAHKDKALKAAMSASEANKQKKAIESLQWKIIGNAARKGYTINSEPVMRVGQKGRTAVGRILGGTTNVSGQNISISKRGSGKSNVVNYSQNSIRLAEEERRRKERSAQLAGAHR